MDIGLTSGFPSTSKFRPFVVANPRGTLAFFCGVLPAVIEGVKRAQRASAQCTRNTLRIACVERRVKGAASPNHSGYGFYMPYDLLSSERGRCTVARAEIRWQHGMHLPNTPDSGEHRARVRCKVRQRKLTARDPTAEILAIQCRSPVIRCSEHRCRELIR